MKIDDILAPWEYNPDSPPKICEGYHFSAIWNGKNVPLSAALIEFGPQGNNRYLAFRLKDDDASWTLGRRNTFGTQTFHSNFSPSIEVVERMIRRAIAGNLLHRQFAFKWEQTPRSFWTAILSASGNGYWVHHFNGQVNDRRTRFHFPAENFFESRAQKWRDKLLAELQDLNSDVGFARRFYLLDNPARRARLIGVKVESGKDIESHFDPLRALWRLAVLSHDKDLNMYGFPKDIRRIVNLHIHRKIRGAESCRFKIDVQPKDERLQVWAELFIDYGTTQLDFDSLSRYTALRDFLKSDGFQVRTLLESSTYHERLEAKLQLLEWAKNCLPPKKYAEIEALES